MAAEDWKLEVRELTESDIPASTRLGDVSFGFPREPRPLPDRFSPGATRHGVFHSGRLVGRAIDLHDRQWWGGRLIDATDVGGVAVQPEARGHGVARTLVTTLLAHAHDRGAVVSTLFPSIAVMYQGFGWARAGSITTVDLPAAALGDWRVPDGHTVRTGTAADLPATRALYTRIATARNGMLSREDERFLDTSGELPTSVDGLTLVEHDGDLVGYCSWARGESYGPGAALTVRDTLALTPDAARAIVTTLRGWGMVTPTIRLRLLRADALEPLLPLELGHVHRDAAWMHRPVDIAGAVAARGWPAHVRGHAVFSVADRLAPWNTGTWELEIADGTGELRRTTAETPVELTVHGFAQLYCGVATAATLRQTGMLSGPGDDVAALDVLGCAPPPQLMDNF